MLQDVEIGSYIALEILAETVQTAKRIGLYDAHANKLWLKKAVIHESPRLPPLSPEVYWAQRVNTSGCVVAYAIAVAIRHPRALRLEERGLALERDWERLQRYRLIEARQGPGCFEGIMPTEEPLAAYARFNAIRRMFDREVIDEMEIITREMLTATENGDGEEYEWFDGLDLGTELAAWWAIKKQWMPR